MWVSQRRRCVCVGGTLAQIGVGRARAAAEGPRPQAAHHGCGRGGTGRAMKRGRAPGQTVDGAKLQLRRCALLLGLPAVG